MPPIEPGSHWAEARIELDLVTTLLASLTLQHVIAMTPGAAGKRAGCGWKLARPEDERVLQRWIDLTQKRQRLRAPG